MNAEMRKAGRLTTHVLDTAKGVPASDLRIELYRLDQDKRLKLKDVRTNDDGRCDEPLLSGAAMQAGQYELVFHVGDYFQIKRDNEHFAFLDQVPLRFGMSDAAQHYHVPLLASPFSYSTYRGS
ncbi:hydroxyisourate hydrolase [Paenochrobactrum sp. BZR 588]|uniref:hydroxyisourate hydrolase n=1 Tax=Paenochrobactrum TaxID=999488 RepID=UPI0035BC215C